MILIAALLLLLAGCSPAAADPGTIGLLILGPELAGSALFSVGAATFTAGQVVGTAAIIGASIALSIGANYLLAKTPEQSNQTGQFTTRQPTPSRRRNYGRVKVSGATMFSEVGILTGGGTPTVCRVIALNEGEIDAFEEFWLDDNHTVLVPGPDAGASVNYTIGPTPYVFIDTRKGLDTETAYSTLTTSFSSIWDSNYRGDGIASLLITAGQPPDFNNFTTAFPGGTAPNPRVVMRACKVWDPRDGDQDKDDPSTWTWTDNPVLIALDFHRHSDGLNLAVYDDTLFTSDAIDEWSDAADICDEVIVTDSPETEPRYRCGGGYSIAEDAPSDVLSAILATCDGQTYQRADGAIGIRVGKTIDPAITLDDQHILGYSELKKGDNVFLAANEVTAKYTSPDHDYQVIDAQPWRDEADITDRGQVLTKAISLPWVQSHSQARRLMKLAHARFNPQWSGTIVTDMAGLACINERYVHVTISEGGLSLIDEDFEIVPDSFQATISEAGIRCSIGISSLDQSAFDWDPDTEAGTPPPVPSDE